MENIAFIDLKKQKEKLGTSLDESVLKVLNHGHYIMGPEIGELETALSDFCGAKHTLSCSNGTDALVLILMAKGITKGDAVFVPSFTFAASAEVVVLLQATPIFVDVLPDTFNMDAKSLEAGIKRAKKEGLKPKLVISVDLFGQPVDYSAIESICEQYDLLLLSDAAQSFGATYKNRKVGTIGFATSTSFFPAKPLGCYGDGGAVFTEEDELLDILKSLRVHGQGLDKYDNIRIGMNGRMDTLQAAILLHKLRIFPEEIASRQRIADQYHEALKDIVQTPVLMQGTTSVWAQYSILLKNKQERERVIEYLNNKKIPSAIYYSKPLHLQPAYRCYPKATEVLSVSEDISQRILSLPMHPYLEKELQWFIIDNLRQAITV